jgi:hypothetical protein
MNKQQSNQKYWILIQPSQQTILRDIKLLKKEKIVISKRNEIYG